ncbi:hypothetical protein Sme01_04970 [Sphaerisporangium melleum]|uniref:Uncharacterized protein n=1 Tax=Sphaerisporangium melleum TaxID=321316 RepID=A0A917QPX8_9ACTN|nr:hypothetical protein [Sphaerisporangium melleum]GGK62895.1 hypothetical protein GCM10007964_02540 [Sphaerisporangium melleum]GII68021.1 hypothetical protein Sme01_04970 [Sphaerisporangium melleum]
MARLLKDGDVIEYGANASRAGPGTAIPTGVGMATSAWWVGRWPVVDPDIPEVDKRRIVGNNALADRRLAADASVAGTLGGFFVCLALLVVLLLAVAGFTGRWDVLDALRNGVFLLSIPLIFVAGLGGVLARGRSPRRLAEVYGDRYVVPADLDGEAEVLLGRAGHAVRTVFDSRVGQMGLLDSVANDIVLPRRLWEIARLLRTQSSLRAEQARATRGVLTPELRAVLEPQRAALRRSVDQVVRQVADLEAYAARAQTADAALHAQELLQSNGKYRDLLAQTDDLRGLHDLAGHADAVEATLARSIQDVIAAGRTLALP